MRTEVLRLRTGPDEPIPRPWESIEPSFCTSYGNAKIALRLARMNFALGERLSKMYTDRRIQFLDNEISDRLNFVRSNFDEFAMNRLAAILITKEQRTRRIKFIIADEYGEVVTSTQFKPFECLLNLPTLTSTRSRLNDELSGRFVIATFEKSPRIVTASRMAV